MRAESCKMFPWPVLGCGEHKFPWEPSGPVCAGGAKFDVEWDERRRIVLAAE